MHLQYRLFAMLQMTLKPQASAGSPGPDAGCGGTGEDVIRHGWRENGCRGSVRAAAGEREPPDPRAGRERDHDRQRDALRGAGAPEDRAVPRLQLPGAQVMARHR